jgi:molybdate transport system regulatory protein
MQHPKAHVRLDLSAALSIGPGKISLLEAIARSGSLSAAARELDMSYRRAWLLLHSINEGFEEPVVVLNAGGKEGGGSRLTSFGETLVRRYRNFQAAVQTLAVRDFADLPVSAHAGANAAESRSTRRRLPPSRRG